MMMIEEDEAVSCQHSNDRLFKRRHYSTSPGFHCHDNLNGLHCHITLFCYHLSIIMRNALVISLATASITSAFLIPSNFHTSLSRYLPQSLNPSASTPSLVHNQQSPMNPGLVQPPGAGAPSSDTSKPEGSDLTISDILPLSRSINIFAQLTRDIASVTTRLSTTDSANTTLLAPLNSAMQDLPRKPWEDRPGDESTVKAAHNEQKAAENGSVDTIDSAYPFR